MEQGEFCYSNTSICSVAKVSRLISTLKSCCTSRNLGKGKAAHLEALQSGNETNMYVATSLINMYGKCGEMFEAQRVFDKMELHNVVSWTALLLGYVENGEEEHALEIFSSMQRRDVLPNARTYVAVIKACSGLASKEDGTEVGGEMVKIKALERGMAVHSQARRDGFDSNTFVGNTLVDLYGKCGSITDSLMTFEKIENLSVVSWTILLTVCVEDGQPLAALELFVKMNCEPDSRTFAAAAKACAVLATEEESQERLKLLSLERGMLVHTLAEKYSGCATDVYVVNTLVAMYVKCGSLFDANRTLYRSRDRCVLAYNSLMAGYVENGEPELALELFQDLVQCEEACSPNAQTYVAALKACVSSLEQETEQDGEETWRQRMRALETGMLLHSLACKSSHTSDLFLASSLMDMYAKCQSMVDARTVFDGLSNPDVAVWNALLQGYVENREEEVALELFTNMQAEGCQPSSRTYVALVQAIGGVENKEKALEKGMAVHSRIRETAEKNMFVGNCLVDMYGKLGSMVDARFLFDRMVHRDVIAWNALMHGYLENGEHKTVLEVFEQMQQKVSLADGRSYAAVLKACSMFAAEEVDGEFIDGVFVKVCFLEKGMAIHSLAGERHFDMDPLVVSSLLDMYGSCGSVSDAERVFQRASKRSSYLWNSLLRCYVENEEDERALNIFSDMDVKPDTRTFTLVLKACERLASLGAGRRVHGELCKLDYRGDNSLSLLKTSLLDFYSKCGSLVNAQLLFDSLASVDGVAFTALMTGYSHRGEVKLVLELLNQMKEECLQPDGVSLVCVLTACSHAGLVDKGRLYFEALTSEFGIIPDLEHYRCMVDLFCRASEVRSAMEILKK